MQPKFKICIIYFCDLLKNGNFYYAGNFNVAEHIQTEENKAVKVTSHVLMGLALIVMGPALLV